MTITTRNGTERIESWWLRLSRNILDKVVESEICSSSVGNSEVVSEGMVECIACEVAIAARNAEVWCFIMVVGMVYHDNGFGDHFA